MSCRTEPCSKAHAWVALPKGHPAARKPARNCIRLGAGPAAKIHPMLHVGREARAPTHLFLPLRSTRAATNWHQDPITMSTGELRGCSALWQVTSRKRRERAQRLAAVKPSGCSGFSGRRGLQSGRRVTNRTWAVLAACRLHQSASVLGFSFMSMAGNQRPAHAWRALGNAPHGVHTSYYLSGGVDKMIISFTLLITPDRINSEQLSHATCLDAHCYNILSCSIFCS